MYTNCVDRAPKTDLDRRRASFLVASDDYDRTRPGYPVEALRWMVGTEARDVVDLGCGPGKLTAALVELGHVAVGVDPSMAMLDGMRAKSLPAVCGTAEAIPLRDSCVDVVTAATAFHWFDHERAVPEMRRVLRAKGRIALVTNIRDETVPWIKSLSEIIGSESAMAATLGGVGGMPAEFKAKLEDGGLFRSMEHEVFDFEQELTEEALIGLVSTRSYMAILPEDGRARLLADVRTLCRTHPELRDRPRFSGVYKTHAFRASAS